MSSERTFVCGNKQSVFSARHNSLLARAHSIFRHCLIGWWVLQVFLHLIKAGQGIGYISSSFVHTTGEKGKTFTGNFSRLAHVFKLGSFVTLLGNDELGWSLFLGWTYRAATGEMMSCR